MIEEWKVINEFPKYEVSNTGKLRNAITGKEIKQQCSRSGYAQYGFRNNPGEKPHTKNLHRYFAIAFIPNPSNLPQVNHIDGNKMNNSTDNLEWVTASRNKKHAFEIGLCEKSRISSGDRLRKATGTKNAKSKWKEHQITEIREKLSKGAHVKSIMVEYDMSYSNVYKIKNRDLWKHV